MKKIVLYCLASLLLSACIKEDRSDDCDIQVRLIFTYEHSIENFDSKVGNEVYLQIYQDNVLMKTEMVPYETIKGGKEYVLEGYSPDTYQFVAWAVPYYDDDICEIPEVLLGDKFEDNSLDLSKNLVNTTYYDPIGNIFLGEEDITIVTNESSVHEISLEPCICRVWFTVYNAGLLMETRATTQDTWIELAGTRPRMSVDRVMSGEASLVYKDLTYNSPSSTLVSGAMGVLPGNGNEYLTVNLYRKGDRIALINTNHRSVAGDEIEIEWTLGAELIVYVNGWRIREATVTYF